MSGQTLRSPYKIGSTDGIRNHTVRILSALPPANWATVPCYIFLFLSIISGEG